MISFPLPPELADINSIDGWLSNAEASYLYYLARNLSAGGSVIVEVGSYKGKSTVCLAAGSSRGAQKTIYAIDPHTGSEEHQLLYGAVNTLQQFKNNLATFRVSDMVEPLVMTSEQASRNWGKKIALLFIDGAHDVESVQRDFDMWWPHVEDGGWVVLHDTTGTWIPGLLGWPGPRKVAARMLFASNQVGDMHLIDTITAGKRIPPTSSLSFWTTKCRLRLAKVPGDALSVGIRAALRLPRPMKVRIRHLLKIFKCRLP
jgi:predicted O-methyltransferase YrrM